ncbi:hypothetical protein FACS1894105_06970 [Clostridia bacterium]|nr:hypothetical protein FACS1894105_06970 [Clostridia bacterium]
MDLITERVSKILNEVLQGEETDNKKEIIIELENMIRDVHIPSLLFIKFLVTVETELDIDFKQEELDAIVDSTWEMLIESIRQKSNM